MFQCIFSEPYTLTIFKTYQTQCLYAASNYMMSLLSDPCPFLPF